MTTVLEKKRKPKVVQADPDKKLSEIIEWAKSQLKTNDEKHATKKYEIINEAATRLEKVGIEQQKISTIISKELKGFVTADYVTQVLPPEYKNQKNSKSGKVGNKKRRDISAKETKEIPNLRPVTEIENTANWIPPTETGKGSIKKEHTAICEDCNQEIREREFGQYQIKPENCIVKDVDKYSRELLIEYVKYLDTENDHFITKIELWDRKVGAVAKENEQLKKKVAELEQQLKEANIK